jgi:acetyl esterase/lipase
MARPRWGSPNYPALDDIQGWRDYVANVHKIMLPAIQARISGVIADVEKLDVDGIPIYDVRPHSTAAVDRRIFFDIHGGGFIVGGGEFCRAEAISLSNDLAVRVWSVDYRLPPDHSYPTPLDDCMTAYRALLEQRRPEEIIIGGASAGANLAAAVILRARDEGLPLPAGAVLHTPALDLTHSCDSFATNEGLDAVLSGGPGAPLKLYAGGHDVSHPYLSPLFGDFGKGFPPTFLSAGTRDLLLSCAVLMHSALRAADVDAELHIIEAGSHGGFHGAPEEEHINREVRKFLRARWGRS